MKLRENSKFPQTNANYHRLFALYMTLGLGLTAKYDEDLNEIVILGKGATKYTCSLYFEDNALEEKERLVIYDVVNGTSIPSGVGSCNTDYFCMFSFSTMKFVLAETMWVKKYIKNSGVEVVYEEKRGEKVVYIDPLFESFPDNPILLNGKTVYYRGFLEKSLQNI